MKQRVYKQIFAYILIFSLLLPMLSVMDIKVAAAVTSSAADVVDSNEPQNSSDSTEKTESTDTISIDTLTQGTQILTHIDENVFTSQKHVARLPKEETLSSYVFRNQDGSKTVYYMDKEVKYQDSSGNIVEKNISLTNTTNGYTTVSNDIGLFLPHNPSNGIRFSYDNYDISIVPEGGQLQKEPQNNGSSVIYPDYFGPGMSLMYTPSLDGLKEDIVLSHYTGTTSFAFQICTDGLHLYQANGQYYLAQSKTANMRIDLGDVVSFDARGRFSVGKMTVATLVEGQLYRLTLTVDEDFLTAESTTYPVSIDPTLTISDNTHGANAIEDITIYSGSPSANCNWSYLHCGYYSSTYKVGRTLFRLTGLLSSSEYQSLTADRITSAEFHIQEATGTAALPVGIYANTGSATWTETGATWNNAGHVLGAQYATASPGSNQATVYDITNLVKAWKNNTEIAEKGFILKSSNETSLDKAFYSSEIATSSYRPYVVVNYRDSGTGGGDTFSTAISILSGNSESVNIVNPNEKRYFKFTPISTGFYSITSSNHTGNPMVWLYNSSQVELSNNNNSPVGTDNNFTLTYHLIANVTYYIAVGHYGNSTGAYTLLISSRPSANTLSLSNATIGAGYSIAISASYAAKYYKLEVPSTGWYFFQSSLEIGDAKIWIYEPDLSLRSYNDNGGGNGKFRTETYLTADTPYYIVLGHNGSATGTYGFTSLMPITIPANYTSFHLQNIGSGLFLDIHGPIEQQLAHQWSLHKDSQERWAIQLESNGYYTIQSQYDRMCYLGISDANIATSNIVLLSSVADNALWKIYGTPNGELLIEPKTAPGKVICVPDSYNGTELQLCWMSNSLANKSKWKINVQWNIVQEGQQMSEWCWAAATRMLVSNYSTVPNDRTQALAVSVSAYIPDNSGSHEDAMRAICFYSSGNISNNIHGFASYKGHTLSEENLRTLLDTGHVLYISRGHYTEFNERRKGHAYVIAGYTTNVVDATIEYQFVLINPYPAEEPNPWDTATQTTAQVEIRSYQWIRNGRKVPNSTLLGDDGIWDGFIVAEFCDDTLGLDRN